MKDVIAENGQPWTCAPKTFERYISPDDAMVMESLHWAGAVLVGQLNMTEFAMRSSTDNSSDQKPHSLWNLEYVIGRSRSGSATAVCAGEIPLALGSDESGSVRQPAACCGIVALKPTYSLVGRYGLSALANSLE
jgi:aspartyl-tRNA(Asn)/glutamyl-tRNA(Gln) amidotransferase subunit A